MATTERPERRTGWTILIVPPNPLRPTRALHVRTRHVRALLGVVFLGLFALAGLGTIVAMDSMEVEATADQLADAHNMILALTDSLRAGGADGEEGFTVAQSGNPAGGAQARPARVAARPFSRQSELGLRQPSAGIVLPVIGEITSRFTRSRFHPLLRIFRPHRGVDVSAPAGTAITAPAAARVAFVGRKLGDGLMVELDHGEGVVSRYAHCKTVRVKAGDFVSFGDMIATVGSSGLSTGPHVHFEVLVRGRPVDPLKYLITARLTPRDMPAAAAAAEGSVAAPPPKPTVPPTEKPPAQPANEKPNGGTGPDSLGRALHDSVARAVRDSASRPGTDSLHRQP
jgi:hypothetical protein